MPSVAPNVSNHVAEGWLNRPDILNAINQDMEHHPANSWERINTDNDIWITINTEEASEA